MNTSPSHQWSSIYRAWYAAAERNSFGPETEAEQPAYFGESPKAVPLEDHVTKELARLVKAEPQPLLRALESKGLLPSIAISKWDVQTHIPIPVPASNGELDMQLLLTLSDGTARELWFEMKVGADSRKQQNENYQAAVGLSGRRKATLVALAKRSLAPDIPLITWTDLADSIDACVPDEASDWQEFKRFLREILATKRTIDPALRPSTERVLGQFVIWANNELKQGQRADYKGFPTGQALTKAINESQKLGKFECSIRLNGYELQVETGLNFMDNLELAVICKRITNSNQGWNLRDEILKRLSQLNVQWWHQVSHEWLAIEATAPRTSFQNEQEMLAWLQGRWREFCATDIPDLLELRRK